MRVYRFRLAPVLRLRRAEEEAARAALVAARLKLRDALSARDAAAARCAALTPVNGVVSYENFLIERQASDVAAAILCVAQSELSLAGGAVAMTQAEWTAARRAVEVLERLDVARRAEHQHEMGRLESIEIDDFATAAFNRRRAGALR
jgi:flagellar FliJ protein